MLLSVEGVTKIFGRNTAVDRASFVVERPAMIGIIGRSGAGKSTFLRMMNRLTDATAGRIHFEGRDVLALSGADKRAWQSQCAMIFQQFNLVPRMDVVSNVLHGTLNRRVERWPRSSTSFRAPTSTAPSTSSTGSASPTRRPSGPRRCRAASSSASPSPAP